MALPVTFYVATTGGDANGGSSEGAPKVIGGSALVVAANPVVNLSADAPDLSTVITGSDTIRLAGITGGRNGSDIFLITAKDDALDTVTVNPGPANGGTVAWAIGGAWATIDRSMNVVSAGEKVWIKATANYNETATIDRAGTATLPITLEGYDAILGDGGHITISGQSTRANGIASSVAAGVLYHVLKNINVIACTGTGFLLNLADRVTFKDCESTSNGGHGFQVRNDAYFLRCRAISNGDRGFNANNSLQCVACKAMSNATYGYVMTGGVCAFCEAFSHGNAGFYSSSPAANTFINCGIDGDSKDTDDGIQFAGTNTGQVVVNCWIYDCTTGIRCTQNVGELAVSCNNLVNSNTTNYVNAATFTGEQTAGPQFLDEATQDYRLATTSPAKATGVDGGTLGAGAASKIDIGPIQRAEGQGDAGGGGGGSGSTPSLRPEALRLYC